LHPTASFFASKPLHLICIAFALLLCSTPLRLVSCTVSPQPFSLLYLFCLLSLFGSRLRLLICTRQFVTAHLVSPPLFLCLTLGCHDFYTS
jgi:hypothetical protein